LDFEGGEEESSQSQGEREGEEWKLGRKGEKRGGRGKGRSKRGEEREAKGREGSGGKQKRGRKRGKK
jgi:hypothetical protein